jgi:anti-sigma regulatory factor (Ser/Thr protein kinase)
MDSPAASPERLRLPARQESLPSFRALALAWAGQAGLADEAVQRLDLVLEETLMNVFFHAYRHHASPAELGDVELALTPHRPGEPPGRLSLSLTDWGVAFDPLAPAEPGLEASLEANLDAGLDERAPGGLGLFLLRTLAKASYARQGQANVLTLTFGP